MRKVLMRIHLTVGFLAMAAAPVFADAVESKLKTLTDTITKWGQYIGILGVILAAGGLIFSPNEEGKRAAKTALIGCVVLALASTLVKALFGAVS